MKKLYSFLGLTLLLACLFSKALADDASVRATLELRQQTLASSFTQLQMRVNRLDPNDPRTEQAKALLKEARKAVNVAAAGQSLFSQVEGILGLFDPNDPRAQAGKELLRQVKDGVDTTNERLFSKLEEMVNFSNLPGPIKAAAEENLKEAREAASAATNLDPEKSFITNGEISAAFVQAEQAARDRISAANLFLIAPVQPGATGVGKPGSVPKGDLTRDFIPYAVRMMFRFTSLAILVAFVVSGSMMVVANENEELVTKAKQMLYYSLLGFALVALAFAVVRAITQVNFFDLVL